MSINKYLQIFQKKIKIKKYLNLKISNMNMYIFFKEINKLKLIAGSTWVEKSKLNNYTLPTFTKKIFINLDKYL